MTNSNETKKRFDYLKSGDPIDFYKLSFLQRFIYKFVHFFKGFPKAFCNFFKSIGLGIAAFFVGIFNFFKGTVLGFMNGNVVTKLSFLVMGLGHITNGYVLAGSAYLLVEVLFIAYMVMFGGGQLGLMLRNFFTGGTIGMTETTESDVWNDELGEFETILGDNSFKILLYGVLTLCIVVFMVLLYFKSVNESVRLGEQAIIAKPGVTLRKELSGYLDKKFHTTMLSLPLIGLFAFTVVPLITMILVAFTNYDASTEVPAHLFSWVGFENFGGILGGNAGMSQTFFRVLGWTLLWAVLATFTNYFLGMILALLINKKGVRFKKVFRTIFVTTIAVPQFVSLLLISKMMDPDGGFITEVVNTLFNINFKFGQNILHTRIAIVVVNMWIGVPYSMLICSGILMNIPADLYESAKIDGSGAVRTFFKITLPYMLFVTGPYLITQFIGNINNFNVIYLLSGGGPGDNLLYTNGAQGTDLLITWLYKLSLGQAKDYKLASVIGILVFVISAVFSLLVYNKSAAVQKEEDFQ